LDSHFILPSLGQSHHSRLLHHHFYLPDQSCNIGHTHISRTITRTVPAPERQNAASLGGCRHQRECALPQCGGVGNSLTLRHGWRTAQAPISVRACTRAAACPSTCHAMRTRHHQADQPSRASSELRTQAEQWAIWLWRGVPRVHRGRSESRDGRVSRTVHPAKLCCLSNVPTGGLD
jgi:hypothetical protein